MQARIEKLKVLNTKSSKFAVAAVVEELKQSREVSHNIRRGGKVQEMPSYNAMLEILEGLSSSLFPAHLGPQGLKHSDLDLFVLATLTTALTRLNEQIGLSLKFKSETLTPFEVRRSAEDITNAFAKQLAPIRAMLVSDLQAAQRRDPSAESLAEVLICYRSSMAIIYHRLAHALHELGARLIARLVSDLAHASTGIDIHPGARIAPGFFIRSGTGVVIGETAVIGENVCLHQGVTLGESEAPGESAPAFGSGAPRHPILENNVVIHPGATILGRVTIGAGSIVYGNVFLNRSIPPGSIVRQTAISHGDIETLR